MEVERSMFADTGWQTFIFVPIIALDNAAFGSRPMASA
jgi:hypothetical protein